MRDPDLQIVRYRWRIGPGAPIEPGLAGRSDSGPMTLIVGETEVVFTRFELVVGGAENSWDLFPTGVTGSAAPSTGPLEVDLLRSTDGGNTFVSMFAGTSMGYLTLPVRQYEQLIDDPGRSVVCNFRDQLRVNVIAGGGAQNVVLMARGYATVD